MGSIHPKLTQAQQTALCAQLGNMTPKLIYQASVHGYSAAAFHQRCDNQGPTLSVGYNNSDHVFGGYTSISFNQSGAWGNDDQAFLFTFNGENLLKYQVTNPAYAVSMKGSHGPYFGENLGLCSNGRAVVHSNPGQNYYNFNAAEMHGDDLTLVECEVYKLRECKLQKKPWTKMEWTLENKDELLSQIELRRFSSVSQIRVLLIGPIGAGKSSFCNSIKSIFGGHVTLQGAAGNRGSTTTQFHTYEVKAREPGKPLPIILCDTMGLEENTGVNVDDISSILRGHIADRYQFNALVPLQPENKAYKKSPSLTLQDRIHCVAYVIDASKISTMSSKIEDKLAAVRRKVNQVGIPQLVLLTKVDEADRAVAKDLSSVYHSLYIKTKLQEAAQRLGVPLPSVFPVKNYSDERELDKSCDILLLSAVNEILRSADNYLAQGGQPASGRSCEELQPGERA